MHEEKAMKVGTGSVKKLNQELQEGWTVKHVASFGVCGETEADGEILVVLERDVDEY